MNVLLIYPHWPETYWSFRHALKFQGKRAAYPPLGLLTVAACCRTTGTGVWWTTVCAALPTPT